MGPNVNGKSILDWCGISTVLYSQAYHATVIPAHLIFSHSQWPGVRNENFMTEAIKKKESQSKINKLKKNMENQVKNETEMVALVKSIRSSAFVGSGEIPSLTYQKPPKQFREQEFQPPTAEDIIKYSKMENQSDTKFDHVWKYISRVERHPAWYIPNIAVPQGTQFNYLFFVHFFLCLLFFLCLCCFLFLCVCFFFVC